MKKINTKLSLLLISFTLFSFKVFAAAGDKCSAFGDPNNKNDFAYYLKWIFNIMQFLGPILVLVFTVKDLLQVTAELKQDPNEFKKLGAKTVKRFIYAVMLFFLPTLINYVFGIVGLYGTCGIS